MTFKQAAFLLLVAVVVPLHFWSFISTLWQVPSWLLSYTLWDMIGFASYIQLFSLVEAVLVFLLLLGLSLLLARFIPRPQFVALSMVLVLLTALWLAYLLFNPNILIQVKVTPLLVWSLSLLIALALSFFVIRRSQRAEQTALSVVSRLAILAVFYLAIDAVLIAIIFVRNFGGAL
jgi:hypothetical protein